MGLYRQAQLGQRRCLSLRHVAIFFNSWGLPWQRLCEGDLFTLSVAPAILVQNKPGVSEGSDVFVVSSAAQTNTVDELFVLA